MAQLLSDLATAVSKLSSDAVLKEIHRLEQEAKSLRVLWRAAVCRERQERKDAKYHPGLKSKEKP
jgi:hypothetical protein